MKDKSSVLGLATVRCNRGITLQQISESTKIGVRLLEAIEGGDFRKLPGGIYTTSYIRQYARAIDYPEDTLLEFYRSHMAHDPAAERSTTSGGPYGGFRTASNPVQF